MHGGPSPPAPPAGAPAIATPGAPPRPAPLAPSPVPLAPPPSSAGAPPLPSLPPGVSGAPDAPLEETVPPAPLDFPPLACSPAWLPEPLAPPEPESDPPESPQCVTANNESTHAPRMPNRRFTMSARTLRRAGSPKPAPQTSIAGVRAVSDGTCTHPERSSGQPLNRDITPERAWAEVVSVADALRARPRARRAPCCASLWLRARGCCRRRCRRRP